MKTANIRLMGDLCPRIKHRIQNDISLYQWFLIPITVLFVSCNALAQGVNVQKLPSAATVSANDFKENVPLQKTDGDSPKKVQDTTFQDKITPLKIGDKIPDELWEMYFPVVSTASEQEQYLSLGDFKDKLIILDFWATWCAPCISSLHKLDTLQKEFEGDLMVVPTSYEAKEKVQPFFANKGWSLPTAYGEEMLKQYFPYRSIPHQVWIKNGAVLAITGGESANKKNIQAVITDPSHKLLKKENREIDRSKPLLIDGNGGDSEDILSYSVLTKRLKTGTVSISPINDFGVQLYNVTLESLLFAAFEDQIDLKRRIIWDISEVLRNDIFSNGRKLIGDLDHDQKVLEWADENMYGYAFTSHSVLGKEQIRERMRFDLSTYFKASRGIEFELAHEPYKTYVLRKLNSQVSIRSTGKEKEFKRDKNGYTFINQPIDQLVHTLLTVDRNAMVVNDTDYDQVDLFLSSKIRDNVSEANKELLEYGLSLNEEYWEWPVLIVRSKP